MSASRRRDDGQPIAPEAAIGAPQDSSVGESNNVSKHHSEALPRVAVIVLNFRGAELTVDCARSVLAQHYSPVECIIVDNASGDGSAAYIRNQLDGLPILELKKNGGYTGGNNAGLALAVTKECKYALIVNNDTVLDADCVGYLVDEMERDSAVAMACPQILCAQPSDLLWFGGSRVSLWTGRVIHVGRGRPASKGMPEPRDIPFATGCALIVRLSLLPKIGVFDESFFGYAEDLDWSLRTRSAGFRIRYVPQARLWHFEGLSFRRSGGESFRFYLSSRNYLRVLRRYARWYHWPTLVVGVTVDFLGRLTLVALAHRDWSAVGALYRGVWHAITGAQLRADHFFSKKRSA